MTDASIATRFDEHRQALLRVLREQIRADPEVAWIEAEATWFAMAQLIADPRSRREGHEA